MRTLLLLLILLLLVVATLRAFGADLVPDPVVIALGVATVLVAAWHGYKRLRSAIRDMND